MARAPNHLGDLVMCLPALQALRPSAVLAPAWLAPLTNLAGFQTIPLERTTRGFASAVLELRRRNFDRGVLFTPSFSSALMLRLGGVRERRGTNTDSRTALLTSTIDKALLATQHRASAYLAIATGEVPRDRPAPRLEVPAELRQRFRERIHTNKPLIGICPGSHATSRSWPPERFAEVARKLSEAATVVVFGAASERATTSVVAGDVAIDLGGQTDLPLLAAGLAECGTVICNDSGPLHLAAAVGARTISVWGAGDPSRTGPPQGHAILRDERLPCLECVKNQCPRSGRGFILPDAYNECLHLITVDQVLEPYSG